jgi:hypothetical protein
VERLVRESPVIIRCELVDAEQGAYKLAEIMKDDGSVALKHRQGDTVRLFRPMSKEDVRSSGNELIVFIGRTDPWMELWDRRDVTELFVIDGRIPALKGISVAEFRALVSRTATTSGENSSSN